jgi:predicted nucleic acid-binding protein
MVVVDTNILVYLLLAGDRTADARALLKRDADWRSEGFALIELTNVLVTAMRVRGLLPGQANTVLAQAQNLIEPGLHVANHADVLALAFQFKVSAYDARFLAVAQTVGKKLVTEDAKLRKAAPEITQSLAEALAG